MPPAVTQATPAPATSEDPNVLFGTVDDFSANPGQIGWHSAPNLHLSIEAEKAAALAAAGPAVSPQPLFTSPLMEPDVPAVSTTAVPAPMTFAAPPPVAAPSPDPIPFDGSTSQQFVFGALTPDANSNGATTPPSPTPSPVPVFGAAPGPSVPVFGAAPTAPSPAVPSPPAPSQPMVFGAAPASMTPHVTTAPSHGTTTVEQPSRTVAEDVADFAETEAVSRLRFVTILLIIVGSYASAVTIVLVYMLIFGRTNDLESLPDLRPPTNKNGDISWKYNPPANNLAPGHVLTLGQSQRFGSLRVTPLKVTRGPLKFEHYTGQPGLARDPSEPVLKLWVKFENVSSDQTFVPLDPWVLFTRNSIDLGRKIQANGFVAEESKRRTPKPSLFYHYDMPIHSEFRIVGQNLNRELGPGDTVETFIPAEEDAGTLAGGLVWRFQFRKGYNRQSKRGVTTLVDVQFKSGDIKSENG